MLVALTKEVREEEENDDDEDRLTDRISGGFQARRPTLVKKTIMVKEFCSRAPLLNFSFWPQRR